MKLVVKEGFARINVLKTLGISLKVISEKEWQHSGDFELHINSEDNISKIIKELEYMGFKIDDSNIYLQSPICFVTNSQELSTTSFLNDIITHKPSVYDIFIFTDALN